jgi:hypothetical protein
MQRSSQRAKARVAWMGRSKPGYTGNKIKTYCVNQMLTKSDGVKEMEVGCSKKSVANW